MKTDDREALRACIGARALLTAGSVMLLAGALNYQPIDALRIPVLIGTKQSFERAAAPETYSVVTIAAADAVRLTEHTTEKSEFVIPAKSVPQPAPKADDEAEVKKPVPVPSKPVEIPEKAEPEPAAKPEPKSVVIPPKKPKPAVRPVKTAARKAPEKMSQVVPSSAPSVPDGDGLRNVNGSHAVSDNSGKAGSAGTETALARILSHIEANKRYPRRARQTGTEGRVLLAVTLSETGVVTSVTVAEKNRSTLLNRAALASAEGLTGQLIDGARGGRVLVPVQFSLSGVMRE